MRTRGRVRAAVAATAALFVCCVGGAAGHVQAGETKLAHAILFSGTDLWRNGAFAYGGLLWAPKGLDRDGFTFKAVISGGIYRYHAGALGGTRIQGRELAGALLAGWRIKRGQLEMKVFAGPEWRQNTLSPDDPGNELRGEELGLRLAAELWGEPTPATMIAADASASTIATDYSARAAFGWRVLDRFYAGPETQVYGGQGYRQWRLGLHVTSLKYRDTEWSAAAGWAFDSDEDDGPYVRLGVLVRR